MAKPKSDKNKLRPDVAETAYRVMLEATGQAPKTVPGEGPRNPRAVKQGRKGGKKGGKSRSAGLTPRKRTSLAKKAAKARWEQKD